jgi:hypothetical protein
MSSSFSLLSKSAMKDFTFLVHIYIFFLITLTSTTREKGLDSTNLLTAFLLDLCNVGLLDLLDFYVVCLLGFGYG